MAIGLVSDMIISAANFNSAERAVKLGCVPGQLMRK